VPGEATSEEGGNRMNGIFVEFKSKKSLDYVQKVCRRKGIDLADYILGNFEWDDMPDCIHDSVRPSRKICYPCEFKEVCEDEKVGVSER
jgi:hypothetical protein